MILDRQEISKVIAGAKVSPTELNGWYPEVIGTAPQVTKEFPTEGLCITRSGSV